MDTLSNKKVYIGYNDEAILVLSQAELMFVYIGGGFLILHVVSAILISKRNMEQYIYKGENDKAYRQNIYRLIGW